MIGLKKKAVFIEHS